MDHLAGVLTPCFISIVMGHLTVKYVVLHHFGATS